MGIFELLEGICDILENRETISAQIQEAKKEDEQRRIAKKFGGTFTPKKKKPQTLQSFLNQRKVENIIRSNRGGMKILKKSKLI